MSFIQPEIQDEKFKTRDAGSYDSVAGVYDDFVDRLSGPFVSRLAALAQLAPPDVVLDVGAGTGIVTLDATKKVAPGGKVFGIDLSDGMLTTANAKAAEAGLSSGVEFRKMDAEALELEDSSFDAVVSLFALRHFPNPLVALKEMHRVLRPVGRLVIGVGSGPSLLSPGGIAHGFGILPELLQRLQGKVIIACNFLDSLVEKYLPEEQEKTETAWVSEKGRLTQSVPGLVKAAGFEKVSHYWQGQRTVIETPDEFWELQVTFSSIARKRVAAAEPDKIEALRDEFMQTCTKVQSRGGKLIYPTGVLFVCGERARS